MAQPCGMGPARMTRPGLKQLTIMASASPTAVAERTMRVTHSVSPAATPATTSLIVRSPADPRRSRRNGLIPSAPARRASRRTAHPPATASRQPVRPHRHTTASEPETRTCPMSPAAPSAPQCSAPWDMSPAPMPVPTWT